ncbi:uncharacterized protein LOC124913680 [Impatiens glandulifera]|uniref:uncharacterized protein LOC124913680 n=1 Tax=Impatiens glandulifera TaxID=253017 RepID=UPI001FB17C9D|nr:uncharacterized protein LOC124913680 [Impatiens glandulifera]
MYVTSPLSLYRKSAKTIVVRPSQGPYSGCLVTTDEEAEEQESLCWGLCRTGKIQELPFPQDRMLKVVHPTNREESSVKTVWFIPVLDQPSCLNRYYVIKARGRYKGLAFTCSREDDIAGCCFRNTITDVKPTSFDHTDIYQQLEIHKDRSGGFYAMAVAGDGYPPKFLRRRGWELHTTSLEFQIRESPGLVNISQLQSNIEPSLDFPMYYKCSPSVVVTKWTCPFMFVKEGSHESRNTQMGKSVVYEMTMERWWEEICSSENESIGKKNVVVAVDCNVKRETVLVYGRESERDERMEDGFVWFKHVVLGFGVGLSKAIVEKMRWVEEKRGWDGSGNEKEVRVEKVVVKEEEDGHGHGWCRFACYVLVESFVLKRMDGVVLLSWKFRHSNITHCRWE